jgi:hypothetical protein
MDVIRNKVAESGIVVLDPAAWYHAISLEHIDLHHYLHMGVVLREKDFREALKLHDWEQYRGKLVAVHCSTDAIVPTWAYMLIMQYLQPLAHSVAIAAPKEAREQFCLEAIASADFSAYAQGRVILKGCGEAPIPPSVYAALTKELLPLVQSLMYGEPCSTVPIYKKKAHAV